MLGLFCYNKGMKNGKPLKESEQYPAITDPKLRKTFINIADKIDSRERAIIYWSYTDRKLQDAMKQVRVDNGRGFKKGQVQRLLYRFPNETVYNFLKAYFTPMYGDGWLKNKKLMKHELLRPWLVVEI